MIIDFLLHKHRQTELALKLQPASPRLLERKAAIEWWIAMDMKKNGAI